MQGAHLEDVEPVQMSMKSCHDRLERELKHKSKDVFVLLVGGLDHVLSFFSYVFHILFRGVGTAVTRLELALLPRPLARWLHFVRLGGADLTTTAKM